MPQIVLRSLGRGPDTKALSSNTNYNQLQPLALFLQWLSAMDGFRELERIFNMIVITAKTV